ncbi:MAG: AAA family ATPase [Oscillibacter sp.]|nr:AAA family ATPase [uncultured Oscillibacter sp.]MCI8971830.1 AAA family ATPase [Oscillibacter sp.]
MNIKQAKQEIENTLKAYLAKDPLGNYRIPPIRQRPILLMGPPGVGKTQIMEQIAAEVGVGLVAYTITHHTRQSAVGLPFIETRTYGGQEYSVTEYTMSEILASVYALMEKTGLKEGILFLDEINCVSETLAPMMLQFLQCKTFGNQHLPEGWLIAAAGNPPEYNRSVRDFDVVTLDRVKRIDVQEDFTVWKEYARAKGLHGAVVSYLDIKKENFYRVEATAEGIRFATARGWEDLSELMTVYESLGLKADREVVGQYIQLPRIARDFANYLELYHKYQNVYHVDEILRGAWRPITVRELRASPFDEKLSVMGLLLSRLSEAARAARRQDALCENLHAALTDFKEALEAGAVPQERLEALARRRREELKRARDAGQLEPRRQTLAQLEINALEDYRRCLVRESPADSGTAMTLVRTWFAQEVDKRAALAREAKAELGHAFAFLEETFGQGQELVLFVTELTAGPDTSWFVETFGCDAYFRHNRELLFDDARRRIREDIMTARAAEQEDTHE